MQVTQEAVFDIVKLAIDELNEDLQYEHLNEIKADTPIFESDLALDSLSLVSLIVDVEGRVADKFDCNVLLASEKAMSMKNSPYRNVGAFVEFIVNEVSSGGQDNG